jgi:hypothetical protein
MVVPSGLSSGSVGSVSSGRFGLRCGLAFRARSPVDDLGFVHDEAKVILRSQAGPAPNGAVDVDGPTAPAAHEVVVVVVDSVFVASGRAGRLDPADQASIGEGGEAVVDRLAGDDSDPSPNPCLYVLCSCMRRLGDRRQHGQPLRRHVETVVAQLLAEEVGRFDFGHDFIMKLFLDDVQK